MTFKNSYLTSMLENFKRRTWLYALSLLFFILYFPVATILYNEASLTSALPAYTAADVNLMTLCLEDIRDNLLSHLGFNMGTAFLLIVCAVLCALQGFGYLDSRQKVDFYHSLPVSKTKRFSIIYLNGLLAVLIPYLISLLLSLIATGFISWDIVGEATPYVMLSFGLNILFYLAVYSLSIIAVLLTGNKVIAFLGASFFMLYEFFFRVVVDAFSSTFFISYSYVSYCMEKTITSPVVLYFIKLGEMDYWRANMIQLNSNIGISAALPLLLYAIVYAGIAYLLFLKRPSEASGKAIAFPVIKPALKLLIMVPFSAITGLLFYSTTNNSIVFLIFGFVIGLLLSHGILEVIFEFELRACMRHGRQLLIGSALVLLFYFTFEFDLLGYDRYVPKPDKVASAAVILPYRNQSFYTYYNSYEEFSWSGWSEYQYAHSKVTDVEAVCSLAEESYKDFAVNNSDTESDDIAEISLKYNMKNGDTIFRTIRVDFRKNEELLSRIFMNPGYKQGAYQIFDEKLFTPEILSNCKLYYSNGVSENQLTPWLTEEFLDIYRQDLMNLSFQEATYGLACGEIRLNYKRQTDNNYNTADWNFPIFPSFQNTIAYLKEHGLYAEEFLPPEKVYSITITNYSANEYDYSDYQEYFGDKTPYLDSPGQTTEYTDEQQIKEILPALYPKRLAAYSHSNPLLLFDYDVKVNIPAADYPDSSRDYTVDSAAFYLIQDKTPEFVLKTE